jgi:hypothetical protein
MIDENGAVGGMRTGRETLHQCLFAHYKSHMPWPIICMNFTHQMAVKRYWTSLETREAVHAEFGVNVSAVVLTITATVQTTSAVCLDLQTGDINWTFTSLHL